MRIFVLARKELEDILTEKVYLLAFLVQMIMVIGIVYTALMYTTLAEPKLAEPKAKAIEHVPKIGIVGEINADFKGLKVVHLNETNKTLLETKELVGIVTVPENFQDKIKKGNASVLLLLDNTNVLSGYADARITRAIQRLSEEIKRERVSGFGDPDAILNPIFIDKVIIGEEKKMLSDSPRFVEIMYGFLLPFILLLPTFLSVNMTTDSIVGEKERKSYEILVSAPLTKTEILIGKILPILIISSAQAFFWMLIIQIKGIDVYNIFALVAFLFLLNAIFIGMGIIISAYSNSIKDADMGVTLSIIIFSLVFFAPVSLAREFYAYSPVTILSKLSSNPVVPIHDVLPAYVFLSIVAICMVYVGGKLLDWKEDLRL